MSRETLTQCFEFVAGFPNEKQQVPEIPATVSLAVFLVLHHRQAPNQHLFPPKYSRQREGAQREHGREGQIPLVTSQCALESFQAHHPTEIPLMVTQGWVSPALEQRSPGTRWWPHGRRGQGCSPTRWHQLRPR